MVNTTVNYVNRYRAVNSTLISACLGPPAQSQYILASLFFQVGQYMLCFPFKFAQHIKDMEVVTMWTWVVSAITTHLRLRSRDLLNLQVNSKNSSPCLHSCAIFALTCNAFYMQPKLHNSADRDISKLVYLHLHLVVCFSIHGFTHGVGTWVVERSMIKLCVMLDVKLASLLCQCRINFRGYLQCADIHRRSHYVEWQPYWISSHLLPPNTFLPY